MGEDLGYGSIPINTIFSGMNIHKSQLFWGSLGTRVLTHPHLGDLNSLNISQTWGVIFWHQPGFDQRQMDNGGVTQQVNELVDPGSQIG